MAAYVKYELGIEKMMEAGNAGTDTWQLILSNTAPNVATHTTAASASELSTGGGYTAGGVNCTVTSATSTSGVYKLVLAELQEQETALVAKTEKAKQDVRAADAKLSEIASDVSKAEKKLATTLGSIEKAKQDLAQREEAVAIREAEVEKKLAIIKSLG